MKKILLAVCGVSVFLISSLVVHAESIRQFNVELEVNKDGSIEVLEKILYDFDWQERHGVFRDIPNSYGEEMIRADVDFLSVTDEDGRVYTFNEEYVSGYDRIRVGDPNSTISGEHWYYISYTVDGVVNGFEDHDELYWNVTGDMWEVPIESSSITITLPRGDGSELSDVACYNGYAGDTYTDCTYDFAGRVAKYQMNSSLQGYQQWTVVAAFDKGLAAVAGYINPRVTPVYSTLFVDGENMGQVGYPIRVAEGSHEIEISHGIRYEPYYDEVEIVAGETVMISETLKRTMWGYLLEMVLPILLSLFALYLVIMLWYKKGRDPKGRGTIMPFYKPP
ncbi:DUF2207 domain-containing protein, partial [Candidatus Peregrinibacteria bacterium]|nr:DUF2207 domain-containing protein [Candidatus Peregrinibacteria bacterium]